MFLVLAWFSEHPHPTSITAASARFEQMLTSLVPDSWLRHDTGSADWGLTLLHPEQEAAWNWRPFAEDGPITVASLGLPVGRVEPGGPVALARRLLSGEDVHAEVIPPFGVLAIDRREQRFALQQDWLGMCRIFVGRSNGVTAFSNRPGILATFLGLRTRPDHAGWSSYIASGHFGGDSSPIGEIRLVRPGKLTTGVRRIDGGWDLTISQRYSVDDLVIDGVMSREKGVSNAIDEAAYALTSAVSSVAELSTGVVNLGLSGGKDSRLIAASFVAAGRLPHFVTNEDIPAEGETARQLTRILRQRHKLDVEHLVFRAGAPEPVLKVGLRDRVIRMQRLYDYQFPSTYTVRPSGPARLPAAVRPPSLTGAGGELAVGYWYPQLVDDRDSKIAYKAAITHHMAAISPEAVTAEVLEVELCRAEAILDHASTLGLSGVEVIDYLYLTERVRRWYTSAYFVGMVTPFLSPYFVRASFAISPADKRAQVLHKRILHRLVPEWADIPYVRGSSVQSSATRIWDGDGLSVASDLLHTVDGTLIALMRRDAVASAIARSASGRGGASDERTLQQFVSLALACQTLEPARRRLLLRNGRRSRSLPSTPASGSPGSRRSVPLLVSQIARRLDFLKRTRGGHAVWMAARSAMTRGDGSRRT